MRGSKKEIIDKDKLVLANAEIKSFKKENRRLLSLVSGLELSQERARNEVKGLKTANRLLRQQLKRIENSRDSWRTKCVALKKQVFPGSNGWSLRVPRHQFSVGMIKLVLLLNVYGGMSLRSCRHSLSCVLLSLGLQIRVPSHVTIRNWLCKHGYGRLQKAQESDLLSSGGKWVLIVDESMIVGGQKLLLILGKCVCNYAFDSALQVSEMQVLYLGLSKSWTKKSVGKVLLDLKSVYEVSPVVSDGSSTLLTAVAASGFVSVRDCSHAYAAALQRQYEKDERFVELLAWSSKMRQKWCMTPHNALLPPKMRIQSRFMNLFHWIQWGHQTVTQSIEGTAWQKELHNDYLELLVFKPLIVELEFLRCKTLAGFEILKSKGASQETLKAVVALLEEHPATKVNAFCQEIRAYLTKIQAIVPQNETFVCCSDVIESTFGKFKAQLERQPRKSLTQFILNIANFDTQFDDAQIQAIFKQFTLHDVKQWFDNQK